MVLPSPSLSRLSAIISPSPQPSDDLPLHVPTHKSNHAALVSRRTHLLSPCPHYQPRLGVPCNPRLHGTVLSSHRRKPKWLLQPRCLGDTKHRFHRGCSFQDSAISEAQFQMTVEERAGRSRHQEELSVLCICCFGWISRAQRRAQGCGVAPDGRHADGEWRHQTMTMFQMYRLYFQLSILDLYVLKCIGNVRCRPYRD
jgi:hypothetical protein